MDFKLKIMGTIINYIGLLNIFGVDINDSLSNDTSFFLSIPDTIKVTKNYIESEIDLEDIKVDLHNYENPNELIVICKQLIKEIVSYVFCLLCIISEPGMINTKEELDELLKVNNEYIEKELKFFFKTRTGEIWNDDCADNKVKQIKSDFTKVLNKYTGYNQV